jgi:hypothetical protein
MTDSSKNGRLYSASGAKHPEAVPALKKSMRVKQSVLSTEGLSAARISIIISAATLIPALLESLIAGKVGIVTSAFFVVSSIFCATKVAPFDGFAAWTVPAYVFLGAMVIGANFGDLAADNFIIRQVSGSILGLSQNYIALMIVTPVAWVIQQRRLVAAKRAQHSV